MEGRILLYLRRSPTSRRRSRSRRGRRINSSLYLLLLRHGPVQPEELLHEGEDALQAHVMAKIVVVADGLEVDAEQIAFAVVGGIAAPDLIVPGMEIDVGPARRVNP